MILLLGGTSDSIALGNALLEASLRLPIILSAATAYGGQIGERQFQGEVRQGRLSQEALRDYCIEKDIAAIVDASHPFAHLLSEQAINIAQELDLFYVRYERPEASDLNVYEGHEGVHRFIDQQVAAQWLSETEGNIMLTTGSKEVKQYVNVIADLERIIVRFLPTSEQIMALSELGFSPKQLIGIQGPFSREFNEVLLRTYQIRYLVTKESGDVGAINEKIEAALNCGCEVVLIDRPKLLYPRVYRNFEDVIRVMAEKVGVMCK